MKDAGSARERSLQKRLRVKVAPGPVEDKAEPEKVEKPPKPHRARDYARKRFAEALPALFTAFLKGATEGDVASLKMLIALSGFDKEEAHAVPAPRRRKRSPGGQLLWDLRKSGYFQEAGPGRGDGATGAQGIAFGPDGKAS